jgi:multiple antibiotic resistance protein
VSDGAKVFLLILSALVPIVDPPSGSPNFLALTSGFTPAMRRELSRRVAIDSFFLMIGSYLIGAHVLGLFGVSLPVVQLGGGMVVVAVGWFMLMQKQNDEAGNPTRRALQPQDEFRQAFYPLTLPLTIGPGSISAAITLGANSTHRCGVHISVILAALVSTGLIALSVFLCYGFSDRLARFVGENATNVIIRLSAFLFLCIGVQIMWNGVAALLSSRHFQVS